MKKLSFLIVLFVSAFAANRLSAQAGGTMPELVMNFYNSNQNGKAAAETGDTIGTIKFNALTQAPNQIRTGAMIRSFVTGPVSLNSLPSNLVFRTGANGVQDRMVVTADGLVGIGTMTPGFNLHVVGNTHTTGDFYGRIHFDDNQNTDDAPSTYIDEAYFELKRRNVLGLPAGPGSHGGLLSLAPGAAAYDHQLFFAQDGIFTRRNAGNAGSWAGAIWYKLLSSEDINGTPNRIAKFTGPNSLGDSQLFDDGANVGIGTTSPNAAYLLTIAGASLNTGNIRTNGNLQADNNIHSGANLSADGELSIAGNATVMQRMSIGTTTKATGYTLSVQGGIITDEVFVQLPGAWPDYVFADNYQLPALADVANHIAEHKHLPGINPAADIENNGLSLGDMQRKQMEKIEELFLYLIQLEKKVDALEAENTLLKATINK